MTKNYQKPLIELKQSLSLLKDQNVITEKTLELLNNLILNVSNNIPTPEDFMESLVSQLPNTYISSITGKSIPCRLGVLRFKDKGYKVTIESF